MWIKENDISEVDLDLTFSVSEEVFGQVIRLYLFVLSIGMKYLKTVNEISIVITLLMLLHMLCVLS